MSDATTTHDDTGTTSTTPLAVRTVLGALLTGAVLLAGGCGLTGDDSDDAPAWTGSWKIVTVDGETSERPVYLSVTEGEYDQFSPQDSSCVIVGGEVEAIEDDVITVHAQANRSAGLVKIRMEPSGGTLDQTIVAASNEDALGRESTADPVEGSPREAAGCFEASRTTAARTQSGADNRWWTMSWWK